MNRVPYLLDWLRASQGEFEGYLFDVDGTLVIGDVAIPGAKELLTWLAEVGLPFLLVTNDANHSHEEKARVLERCGIRVRSDSILSAGDVIAKAAVERSLVGRLMFVMGNLGSPDYATEAGIEVTRELERIEECCGVIVGEEDYDWQSTFNSVVNFFVRHPDMPFIVPNPDIYWSDGERGIAIAAGGKARFIASVLEEYGIPVQPEYLGKPHRAVFEFAQARLGQLRGTACTAPERILLVGDSLKSDIRGANRAGFTSALVRTGVTVLRQLDGILPGSEMWPNHIIEHL
jgi:HAD superfamily hydrolase (TIGR01450 family)